MSPGSKPRPPVYTTGWTRPRIPLHLALFASHVGMFLLPLLLLLGTGAIARDQGRQRQEELGREAQLAAAIVAASFHSQADESVAMPALTTALGPEVEVRVVDAAGLTLAGTSPDQAPLPAERDAAATALSGEPVVTTLHAFTIAAAPVQVDGKVIGAVVVSRTNRRDVEVLAALADEAGWRASVVAIVAMATAAFAGWRVSRSLRALARVTREVTERGERGEHARWLLDATVGTRIAEVRQVASSFRDTLNRLEERLAYNQEFASNVSHEFRTPLTTLRGTVDLLRDDEGMPPEQRRLFLANARTDLDRLLRMLKGLLDLARVDANDETESVSLRAVVATVLARDPETGVEGEAAPVAGDAALLELAVRNLLDNAQLHGGPTVRVRLWTRGARTGLDVEDDGAGISEANLPKIFDRFFTTGRERQGTGLGLAIVRAIARAHDGEVRVESAPGRTVFTLDLPAGPQA